MNKKALLPLALIVLAAGFTGCSHQTTRTGSKSNYAFGLVEVERSSFQPTGPLTVEVSTNDYIGNSGKISGKQTKVMWGLFTFSDY